MRLDKFLAECGLGTRSEVKKTLKKNVISVNGNIIKDPAFSINENADIVLYKNEPLKLEGERYYLFYKPSGCVTAATDNMHKTVMDYFPESIRNGLNPVGRLDLDTEGLLILTTDGNYLHQMISPKRNVEKTYYAILDAEVPKEAIMLFEKGIDIGDDKPTKSARLKILEATSDIPYSAELTITEGRFHQVKRMFHAVGCEVTYLKRIREGNLTLEGLKPGEYRKLDASELEL